MSREMEGPKELREFYSLANKLLDGISMRLMDGCETGDITPLQSLEEGELRKEWIGLMWDVRQQNLRAAQEKKDGQLSRHEGSDGQTGSEVHLRGTDVQGKHDGVQDRGGQTHDH